LHQYSFATNDPRRLHWLELRQLREQMDGNKPRVHPMSKLQLVPRYIARTGLDESDRQVHRWKNTRDCECWANNSTRYCEYARHLSVADSRVWVAVFNGVSNRWVYAWAQPRRCYALPIAAWWSLREEKPKVKTRARSLQRRCSSQQHWSNCLAHCSCLFPSKNTSYYARESCSNASDSNRISDLDERLSARSDIVL